MRAELAGEHPTRLDTPPSAADLGPNSTQGGRVSEQIAQMRALVRIR